jgi:DNA-binding LacI/PurR family transcriptional regulator
VTNVLIDHNNAIRPALQHLHDLGHRRIAFMKGQTFSLDSTSRWESIHVIAQEIGMKILPELCISLEEHEWSPELGYVPIRALLSRTQDFTALVCFNDTSAIGALRAIEDAGLSCPQDISVIGFDDILMAKYTRPRLTTVRQPLHKMGQTAAELLIRQIQAPRNPHPSSQTVWFAPELVVRESTTAAPPMKSKGRSRR